MFVMTVACVLVLRFSLLAVAGDREELLRRPTALAPEPGGAQVLGEVSGGAEAREVRAGMALGEALAQCPDLALLPPDPERAAELWERALGKLEGIGAAVESERAGEAFFGADGLRGLHGGIGGALRRARRAVPMPTRVAAGPSRFVAYAAAIHAKRPRRGTRREVAIDAARARDFLSPLPVSLLGARLDPGGTSGHELVAVLERLGVKTLGMLAELPEDAVADRLGRLGLKARRLAGGDDEPLRPRNFQTPLLAIVELPEAAAGPQLERALAMLVDRLLADPARQGRTVRALSLGARLAGGGGWRREVALRRPSASPELLRVALAPRLLELPGPACSLVLEATALGPRAGEQLELTRREEEQRRSRLAEAVRQVRAVAGPGALLRVLEVDSESRVPERRTFLTPFNSSPP
jgi:nucleotidyltransferase/DNA polymerase involved in DNA repair